jgi:hypothetical protein
MFDMPPDGDLMPESAAARREELRLLQLALDAYLKCNQSLPLPSTNTTLVANEFMDECNAAADRADLLAEDAPEIIWAIIEQLERQKPRAM